MFAIRRDLRPPIEENKREMTARLYLPIIEDSTFNLRNVHLEFRAVVFLCSFSSSANLIPDA